MVNDMIAKSINDIRLRQLDAEINLVESTFGRIRPSPGRYDIRSNTSNTATYMYKIVSKL